MQVAVLLTWIPSRVAEPGAVGETFRKFLFLEGDLGVVGVGLARIGVPTALLVLTGFAGLHVLSYRVRGIHCHAAALATPGFSWGVAWSRGWCCTSSGRSPRSRSCTSSSERGCSWT